MTVLPNHRDNRLLRKWMLEFLECDGLGVLLESLEKLGARGFSSVADTFSRMQCVGCLRAVMNSQVGLEYIVHHREYTRQLANILMSRNNSVKLQVFELLCALCMYSSQGHMLALDSLNYFKSMVSNTSAVFSADASVIPDNAEISHGRRYRFDLVINELQTADTVAYQTTLLCFVNCAILGASGIDQRNRIRTELFGVGLEKVLSMLRFVEDDKLQIQLKVFDDSQAKDEEQQEPLSVCHLFDVVYKKVANTPQVLALQSVLLALSQMDPTNPESDRVWESLQDVVSEGPSTKSNLKTKPVRTREYGTQTTGNRWFPTRRRASCTIGVQVDDVKLSPALSLPSINGSADLPDMTFSSSPLTSKDPLASDSSVEICKNCLRKFVREEPQTQNVIVKEEQTRENSIKENIPNNEVNSSPTRNQRLSFTKIRKSPPPQISTSSNSNGITVEEPFIKNIVPTVSPTSSTISRSPIDDRPQQTTISPPIPPPLPNGALNSSVPSSCSFSQSQLCTNVPPPPPLSQTPLPNSSTPPPPPPLPVTSLTTPPPPPPPPPQHFIPPPPPIPFNAPPPPPMPFRNEPPPIPSTPGPPPPPMPFVHSTPQSNCMSTPPPPPPMCSPMNGSMSPVSEPLITCERVTESMFAASPYKTTASYHTLPSRRLNASDLASGFNKYNTLPKPSKKMKTLNWTKVPNQVIGKSVWANATLPPVSIDYSRIEELFCQKPRPKSMPAQSSLDVASPALTTLLESKRSLAVNIFLKQFKSGAAGVLDALRTCEGLSAEKLKGLLRILPEDHEVSLIKSHLGDASTLDTAESFYAELLNIPDYTLRVQAMLQKEECPLAVSELTPQLESLISMSESLIHNSQLAEFFALLLQLGNYLNAGSYAGNAAGFKLNTLPRLLDTRANKPRVTFLHFAVDVAQTHRQDLLSFTDEMNDLKNMARNPLSAVEEELRALAVSVRKLDKQVRAAKSKDLVPKFKDFLKKALKDIEKMEKLLEEAKIAEKNLAIHFCEDPKKFKLEDCFVLLADFFGKIKQAIMDNDQMKRQEERAAKMEADRLNQSTPQAPRRRGGKQRILMDNEETALVDILMSEIKNGNFKLRRSIPAGNG